MTLQLTPLLLLVLTSCVQCWINEYDQPVHFQCPTGQFLSHVNSQHDNSHEDRVWDFECRVIPADATVSPGSCHFTNFINEWDQPLTYQCPGEGFISGTESVHDNHSEDRRFKFQCCEATGTIMHNCFFTNWENEFDGVLDYIVPSGKVMRGVDSYHDNSKEDRRFKFEICDMDLAH